MKKIKKLIMILIIAIFIIIVSIFIINNNNLEINNNSYKDEEKKDKLAFSEIDDYKTYYTVKEIINEYITYMRSINGDQYIEDLDMSDSEIKEELQKEATEAIIGVLDDQYIKEMNTDEKTIKKLQDKYKQKGDFTTDITYNLNINDVAEAYINEQLTIELVEATLNNKELKMIIKLDKINNSYSIFLEDFIEKYNYSKDMNKSYINIDNSEIKENGYNNHIQVDVSDKYIIAQYFSEYRTKMLNDIENAYKQLNEDYRNEKFENIENFKKYIYENKEIILYASIDKYQINEKNGTKEYICVDTNGKYYIFMEKGIINYEVVLDTYTIDLPDFIEKYNNYNETKKTGLNIQKIFDSIKDGDYNYAYKKIDETFKENNFPTEESFKKYAKQYLFGTTIEHNDCETSGELFIYDITITQENGNDIKKTVIMKLLEGTDFVFSFDV